MPCQSGLSAATFGGLLLIAAAAPAGAGPTGWAHQAAGFQSNGSVTVKSFAGGSYVGTQNPTGAVAKANQSAATQAPTVIVQATASLPIKSLGEACVVATSGTSPNQTATEGTAILADRSALLTCQSGVWSKGKGSGSIRISTGFYTASCNALTEVMTGGGCATAGYTGDELIKSYPSSANVWNCTPKNWSMGTPAYAICLTK